MIEVRIDIDLMQNHQHNIMHSVLMMDALRAAGMPVIGKIVFNGPVRGALTMTREVDMDDDTCVVRWYDSDEVIGAAPAQRVDSGSGRGYVWVRYANPNRAESASKSSGADDWDEEEM